MSRSSSHLKCGINRLLFLGRVVSMESVQMRQIDSEVTFQGKLKIGQSQIDEFNV